MWLKNFLFRSIIKSASILFSRCICIHFATAFNITSVKNIMARTIRSFTNISLSKVPATNSVPLSMINLNKNLSTTLVDSIMSIKKKVPSSKNLYFFIKLNFTLLSKVLFERINRFYPWHFKVFYVLSINSRYIILSHGCCY